MWVVLILKFYLIIHVFIYWCNVKDNMTFLCVEPKGINRCLIKMENQYTVFQFETFVYIENQFCFFHDR